MDLDGYEWSWIEMCMDIGLSGYLAISISGYLDIWISGYLDSGKNNLLLHLHSEMLCGAALPGTFFSEKHIPGVLQPKTMLLQFYLDNIKRD